MTLQEAAIRFQVSMEKLDYYEKNGLLECRQQSLDELDYMIEKIKKE